MEYREKLEIACKKMSEEFEISEKQAEMIIVWLDLEDLVFERYEEDIIEAERNKFDKWELEIKMNPGLF